MRKVLDLGTHGGCRGGGGVAAGGGDVRVRVLLLVAVAEVGGKWWAAPLDEANSRKICKGASVNRADI